MSGAAKKLARWIWRLWFALSAVWLALVVAGLVWFAPAPDLLDAAIALALDGIAPIWAGTVVIYWAFLIGPWWRQGRQST